MINYKWLRIINYLYIVVAIAVIGLSLTIPPRASALRRALPAIVAILSIDALCLLLQPWVVRFDYLKPFPAYGTIEHESGNKSTESKCIHRPV